MRTRAHVLALGCLFDARHALYLCVKALRVVTFVAYTRAVAWELRLGPDELSEDLT